MTPLQSIHYVSGIPNICHLFFLVFLPWDAHPMQTPSWPHVVHGMQWKWWVCLAGLGGCRQEALTMIPRTAGSHRSWQLCSVNTAAASSPSLHASGDPNPSSPSTHTSASRGSSTKRQQHAPDKVVQTAHSHAAHHWDWPAKLCPKS